ncbi:MAG: HAMP domain-containing protein [Candidatus Firestonebacteria bacterium]|nr:HAMP domain-containing protein [Candidatus Firestonebacteria bacterium]
MRFYQKISLPFIGLAVIAVGAIFAFFYYSQRAAAMEQAQQRAQLLGKAIQTVLTEIVRNPSVGDLDQLDARERVLLQRFIRRFGEADGFARISVFNRARNVVVHVGDSPEQAFRPLDQSAPRRLGKNEVLSTVEKNARGLAPTFIVPLEHEGDIWGFAGIELSPKVKTDRPADIWRISSALLAVTLMLVVVISMILGRAMAKPIQQLVAGARKIAEGNYDFVLPAHGQGELAVLTYAFNYMVNNLKRLQAEREFREALKVAGELGRSVAHEIRNPLNMILLSMEQLPHLLQGEAPDRKRAEKLMETIKSEINRINGIVRNFLEYAQTKSLSRTADSIAELLQSTATLVGPQAAKQHVVLDVNVAGDLGPVPYDPDQMRQALLNLVINAFQAMPQGGHLGLSAERQKEWVHIQVSDQGEGITLENLEKVFEPDFSTKVGGSGIGLAVVKRIAEQHGGHVAVSSREGQGSAFSLWLPILSEIEVAEEQARG